MRFAILTLIATTLIGCPYGYSVPRDPTPLAALNTEYDDYNAAAPPSLHNFVWSSNRGSAGKHFDLWQASGRFLDNGFEYGRVDYDDWDKTQSGSDDRPRLLARLASPQNEFGPCYTPGEWRPSTAQADKPLPLVFASDRPGGIGKLDLYIATSDRIEPLPGVNSPANDAYWSGFKGGPEYFASDRGGKGYDIYEIDGDNVRPVDALNSPADDTAPFVLEYAGKPRMLFVSNRKGGRGQFDIYWARRVDGKWQKPINLKRFNTRHNEFRPAPTVNMVVFSSDRPGGKGGYDLYYARLPNLN